MMPKLEHMGDMKTQLGLLGLISSTRSTKLYIIYHVQKCVMVQSIIVCAAQECQQKATDQIRDVEIGGVLFRLYVCEDCLKKWTNERTSKHLPSMFTNRATGIESTGPTVDALHEQLQQLQRRLESHSRSQFPVKSTA